MIQRIQSLWLALAVVCIGLCFVFPVAKYQYADKPAMGQRLESRLDLVAKDNPDAGNLFKPGETVVPFNQSKTEMPTWPLVTLAMVSGLLGVACIFLFKNRRLQMRLATMGFMTTLIYVFLLFFWAVDKYADMFSNAELTKTFLSDAKPEVIWGAGAFIPMAALVFFFLAQRAIRRDEAMVRAADRLR